MVKKLNNIITCGCCNSVLQYEDDDIIVNRGVVKLSDSVYAVEIRKISCPICFYTNTIDNKITYKI